MELRIKGLRAKTTMTQVELAKKVGVNQSAVAQWEIGLTVPRTSILPKLAEALGVSIQELYEEGSDGEEREGKEISDAVEAEHERTTSTAI